jgi:hypothetical protein
MRSMSSIALTLAAIAGIVVVGGCGQNVGEALATAARNESGVEANVAHLGAQLKAGEVLDTGVLAHEEARLTKVDAQVSDLIDKGGLTTEQQQKASETTAAAENTTGEIRTEQSIATQADSVAQGSSGQEESLPGKFVRRAHKVVCEHIRLAQLRPGDAGPSEAQEEGDVAAELGPGVQSTYVHAIVANARAIANRQIETLNNIIAGNQAGAEAILQKAYTNLSCS